MKFGLFVKRQNKYDSKPSKFDLITELNRGVRKKKKIDFLMERTKVPIERHKIQDKDLVAQRRDCQ